MSSPLAALLIPPQEQRLRSRFDLGGTPLRLITSGWQKLIVQTPDRVFAFPRTAHQVSMIEREADVLSTIRPDIGPRLLGRHRDPAISPYPFLELTRIPGVSWDHLEQHLQFDDAARCLEQFARHIAHIHALTVPPRLTARPDYLDRPRITTGWTHQDRIATSTAGAAKALSGYTTKTEPQLWTEALIPIATMKHTAVHGELSDGQFLLDHHHQITGIVDWDGLHLGHPLLDLDFGIDLYRVYGPPGDRDQLRRRIWNAYAAERGGRLPNWNSVQLFWCILDAITLLRERDTRLPAAVAELDTATGKLRS